MGLSTRPWSLAWALAALLVTGVGAELAAGVGTPAGTLPALPQSVDPADRAWDQGEQDLALSLYLGRLERNPADAVALHRVALLHAWSERYDEARVYLDRLLDAHPGHADARVDRARITAWSGDLEAAAAQLDAVLASHPGHVGALEARASVEAWAGRYESSLSTWDRILEIAPDHSGARRQRAQVLTWASDMEASRAIYDSLLVDDPGDAEARLGLAQVLLYADDVDGALEEYRRVLADAPGDARALGGIGRALSWSGRLVEGQRAYERAIETSPGDVAGRVGLAQNLRWQGRNAAALEVLEEASRLAPGNGDVREQLTGIATALGPQVRSVTTAEDDSDGNRMLSESLTTQWHPAPRLGLRADLHHRTLSSGNLDRTAYGLALSATLLIEPGWTLRAGLGGAGNDGGGRGSQVSWSAGAQSPARHRAGGSIAVSSSALDATAGLAERGVRVLETGMTGYWTPAPGWRLEAAASHATFQGTQRNRRLRGGLTASRRLAPRWTLAGRATAFGFERNLVEGYFDPDFFGLVEATLTWERDLGRLAVMLLGGPGIQKVGKAGEPGGALRGTARVGYRLAPGREVSLQAAYSSAGLQSFSNAEAGYRYAALSLAVGWLL